MALRHTCRLAGTIRSLWSIRINPAVCQPLWTINQDYSELNKCNIAVRKYGTKKGKGKAAAAHKMKVELSNEEIAQVVDIEEYRQKLDKQLTDMKQNYQQNLSLRTSTVSFEKLLVKTKDGHFPLNHIASIIQKSPVLMVINMTNSSQYVADVMDALRSSGMNISPQQDGPNTIYIQIPKVSREHREELAKSAKTLFNDTKTYLTRIHSSDLKKISRLKSSVPEDLFNSVKDLLLIEMQTKTKEAETIMKEKQKELLDHQK